MNSKLMNAALKLLNLNNIDELKTMMNCNAKELYKDGPKVSSFVKGNIKFEYNEAGYYLNKNYLYSIDTGKFRILF